MTVIAPKGWCPSLYSPMPAGDGLLVRVHPPGGRLHSPAARALARAAQQFGNGTIDLGMRGSLQIRGLRPATIAAFQAEMVAAGLAHPDPQAEARRNLIAPPLAGDDPTAAQVLDIVGRLEALQATDPLFSRLHGKFGLLVDAGGILPVGAARADIRIFVSGGCIAVQPDGAAFAAIVSPATIDEALRSLVTAFLRLSEPCAEPLPRMRQVVARLGAERLFADAELHVTVAVTPPPTPQVRGWLPYPGGGRGAFGIGLPFGSMDAATLTVLARIAEQHGGGSLHLTPWRALVITNVRAPDALQQSLSGLPVIADPDDPLLRIAACPGEPACMAATVPTRSDALRLLALGLPGMLHVAGCAKGCAHPAAADVTLVGEAGHYALVHAGTSGDRPMRTGMTIEEVIATLRRAVSETAP
jgi:precorrin-3B synthase